MVVELDAALAHYATIIQQNTGKDVARRPGAGAAGGLGAGLLAFASAELIPGAKLVLDTLGFDDAARNADLVITAEGLLDAQTAYGKSVGAVATRAHAAGARVIALAGGVIATSEDLITLGIDVAIPLPDRPLSLDESMARSAALLAHAAERIMRLISLGYELGAHQP
jgi:glycerate kinase